MDKSEHISELAAALAKAQGAFTPVGKTGNNPFLKTNYVTLDGIIEMSRGPLSAVGLSYTQILDAAGEDLPTLTTVLMHSSGQWISSSAVVRSISGKGTNELQELGRSITYMKRYALAAMLGVSSDEDTDGEFGSTTKRGKKVTPTTWQELLTMTGKGIDDLGGVEAANQLTVQQIGNLWEAWA